MKKILLLGVLSVFIVIALVSVINSFVLVSKADADTEDIRLIINNGSENIVETEKVIVDSQGSKIYVPLDFLKESFDIKTDYDPTNNIAIITTLDKVIRFYEDGRVKINQAENDSIPRMILQDEKVFLPISHLKDYLKIESIYVEETNTVILTNLLKSRSYFTTIKDNTRLRAENRLLSNVVHILPLGEKVQLISEAGNWLEVMNSKGYVGYVNRKSLKANETVEALSFPEKKTLWPSEKGKILLAWEHVHSKNPDTSLIGDMGGLNVISPTWISLKDGTGAIIHNIDKSYIKWAKARDYQVWALFSNQFNPDLTNAFLNDALSRERAINEVLSLVAENDMDGVNIDFENVYLKDKERLVQFVRELVPIFHEKDLIVSIDVTVKSMTENWSLCYDRRALGEVVDYMAVMAYDEHWSSSPKSGSVASIGWVERGITGILEEVPAEKLLLGIPLYTRIWTETPTAQGIKVSSKAVGMETVNRLINENKLEKRWDEATGQYYVEYPTGESINKIWIEDIESIKLKYALVNKYNMGGTALWRRGFETPDIWEVFQE